MKPTKSEIYEIAAEAEKSIAYHDKAHIAAFGTHYVNKTATALIQAAALLKEMDARIAELHKVYEVKLGNDSYSQQWCCGAIQALKELTKEIMSDIEKDYHELQLKYDTLFDEAETLQAELASIKQQVVFVDEGEQPEVGDLVEDYSGGNFYFLKSHNPDNVLCIKERAGKPVLVRK